VGGKIGIKRISLETRKRAQMLSAPFKFLGVIGKEQDKLKEG